jgi:HEPN domain-containing protein
MSNPIRPITGTPEDWLRHAKSDLAVAQSIENNSDVLPNQTAFHAQQAAEKAIKGAMIQEGIAFPLTHDLKDLVKRWTSSGRAWPAALIDVKTLTPYAVESRYPGYIHQISRAEVRAAIEVAEQVIAWADAQIHPPSPAIPGVPSK